MANFETEVCCGREDFGEILEERRLKLEFY